MPDRAESSSWGNKPRYGEFEIVGAAENKPRLLGEGSFGKTYEAVRTDSVAGGVIKENVAIKVLNPALLISESRRFQFIQELVALTKFKHSNLIHYIRCGEDEGEVYCAMELCRGGDLTRLVRRYRVLPEKVVALIGLQVATGLREVHQRHRLVHRDIKPSNIMLVDELESGLGVTQVAQRLEEQEGLCRIVDFGLVNFAFNLQEAQQRFVGSPMYASPEQISEQAVDGRSDIYSLGMTLWFLVQGKGPLLDANGNDLKGVHEAMRRHTSPEEHELSLPPHVSAEFRRILARMLAKRPDERYATAAEVQHDLREYLSTVAAPDDSKFTVTRLAEPLSSAYTLEESLPSRAARRCHAARKLSTGERVKLSVMAEATEGPETEALAEQLCGLAELAGQPARIEAALPVREVIWAADVLAFTEELPPHCTLAEALQARQQAGRPVAFPEAVALLGPIAEALDFLIEQGRQTVFLSGDDLWLTGSATPVDPLTPWAELQVQFSLMSLPEAGPGVVSPISSLQETLSGSLQITELNEHPIPALARLIYFIMSGTEVPPAALFTPTAYVPVAPLGERANDLLRDLLCRQNVWTHATAVLRDLCSHEGVVWHPSPPHPTAQRGTAATGTSPSAAGSSSALPPGYSASGSAGSPQRRASGAEKVCEVLSPGVVCSPDDPERRPQEVPAHQWVPSGRVRCQITQKTFRLPRKLGPLLARVVSPGVIQSPYAAAEVTQAVPWEDWVAGGEIVCAESGRRIELPQGLPAPEGLLPPQRSGVIISPFDRVTVVPVPPERWEPGAGVICPATQGSFVLPKVLPPLEAMADASRPGILGSPYAPTMTWPVEPAEWVAGREWKCPMSGKPLRLPITVERWPAEGRVVDLSRRLVSNPFRPDSPVTVPASAWSPSATLLCPETGRTILLPANLPLLVGEIVEDRPGVIRSPYSAEVIAVPPKDWMTGVALTCPRTQMKFLLPGQLPEWIPAGSISGLPPGQARSPYEPDHEIPVKPDEWQPNQILKCPETGRRFRLPGELPPLEAKVKAGRPGQVLSPFSGEWQEVLVDDWKPGQRLECAKTGRPFRLPDAVEDWQVDGEWVPGSPGRIRSPYHPHPELDLTAEQWRPRQVLTCPATQRRFRAPITPEFPSIELEKDAVQQALAEPEATETQSAELLQRQHRSVTPEQVQAIWQRHDLGTLEKRRRAVQVAEVIAAEPGVVRSPYGGRCKVEVPPALWLEPGASLLCPETGRRFLLPAKRPALFARLVPGEPGRLISPYQPETPFRIPPEHWQAGRTIRCEHTSHPLQLPADLPDWTPVGTLPADQPGVVLSPFGRHGAVRVPGENWTAGAPVKCLETQRVFVLPEQLPPLAATVVEECPGRVLSPYAANRKVRVPLDQWKPGARVKCPATQRFFVLPETLPVWNEKPFSWKRLAALAAAVVVIAGGWWVWSQPRPAASQPEVAITPGNPAATSTPTPIRVAPVVPEEPPILAPEPRRVVLAGGLEIEEWPKKKELPKTLRVLHRGRPVPLKMESTRLTVMLPPEADEDPATDELEFQMPGWKSLKLALPARVEDNPFKTQSTSILAQTHDLRADGAVFIKERPRLERQRVSLPVSIIPEGGTDYEYLDAAWVGGLSQEPDATPPPTNPIRLRIAKGEIERPLPTGIYDFTLRGGANDKVTVVPRIWKAGVPMSSKPVDFYTLPPALAGDYLGLMFTVRGRDKQLEGGYFFSVAVGPKLSAVKALVNPIPIRGGEVINLQSMKADKDELGTISNIQLTDPNTLEFNASLRMFDYHWTLKAEENGTRFLYGRLIEFKDAYIEQEKARLEQMFREKARSARVPALAADRIAGLRPDQYRILYEENLKEAKQKAQYLLETYPDMKVTGSSIYFGLHSAQDVVRVVRLKNGDWDLQKDPR